MERADPLTNNGFIRYQRNRPLAQTEDITSAESLCGRDRARRTHPKMTDTLWGETMTASKHGQDRVYTNPTDVAGIVVEVQPDGRVHVDIRGLASISLTARDAVGLAVALLQHGRTLI